IKDPELLESRRRTIATTAARLFAERGYANVSVNEIAAEENISIGSLYKYVRTKEDILWLVIDDWHRVILQAIEGSMAGAGSPAEKLRHLLSDYVRRAHSLRHRALMVYREFGHLSPETQPEFARREGRVLQRFEAVILE